MAGSFDAIDQEASAGASRQVHERLQALFPEFRWRLMVVERAEIAADSREEPVAFSAAQAERDLHQWDFVIVLTNADLIGHDKPYTFAAVSRTLDIAVMSTARVDPHAMDADATREVRPPRDTSSGSFDASLPGASQRTGPLRRPEPADVGCRERRRFGSGRGLDSRTDHTHGDQSSRDR
ncbi:MAG: hypothetical protein R3B91_22830 [Planctomycetaceae bacterium]